MSQIRTLDVSVIVPHYAGDQLTECLDALSRAYDQPARVIVVDDASQDGSTERAHVRYPDAEYLRNPANLGFVGACNRGLAEATSAYAVLLNDDALVEEGWLATLVAVLEDDHTVAAVQPKIVNARQPERFDYAGAAGGLMDRYGYPYALGRWFGRCEVDRGQYDNPREIFWASGTAMCLRMAVYREIGGLEAAFGMHMEEIDWCWRARIAGYRIVNAPSARVRHYGAMTLKTESYRKMYFNHRNSILMLLKNYSFLPLMFAVLPGRLALECLTAVGALLTGDFRRALAAVLGPLGAFLRYPRVAPARRRIQSARKRSDAEVSRHLYGGSIALRYLLRLPAPRTGA